MKDMGLRVPKGLNVISIVLLLITNSVLFGQRPEDFIMSDAEYEVINSVFSRESEPISKKQITKLYFRTDFDKGWLIYFNTKNRHLMYDKRAILGLMSDEEIETLLTDKVIRVFSKSIIDLVPYELESSKLNYPHLTKSFDGAKDLRKKVFRISKPIIVDDLAIMRYITLTSSTVFILQKIKKWEIVYSFDEWYIMY